jgi:inosine-uridine nucleoside N-ribohydrolase
VSGPALVARVHVDTDPGVDDLLALSFALACPELRVVALTTVAGNADLDRVTDNALRLCALTGLELPVGRGPRAAEPPAAIALAFHGADGRRGIELPAAGRRAGALPDAAEVLRQSLVERRADVVVALGPLTNLAALLRAEPQLWSGVRLVWMGGALDGGNVTPVAEFNCWVDPAAADAVLGAGLDLRVIGLDVTRGVGLRPADLPTGALGAGARGRFLEALVDGLMDGEEITAGERVAVLHDPCAIAAALDSDLFRYERRRLGALAVDGPDRGRLVERRGSGAEVRWAVEVHHRALLELVVERLRRWAGAGEVLRHAL